MTANPDLVAYIRKHWKHGAPALRRKLVHEGLDEGEVDAAILAATPKPKSPNAKRLPGAIAGGIVSALLVFWALRSAPEHAVRKPGEKQVLIQENPNDPSGLSRPLRLHPPASSGLQRDLGFPRSG